MRYTFIIAALLFALSGFSQVPQKINYQGVARNNSGVELANQLVGLRLSILQGSTTGAIVYRETHSVTSNQFGLFDVQIGNGTVINGAINTIDWAAGPFYLQTEMDVEGGTNYTLLGASELISVPYALYAEKAGSTTSNTETTNCGGGGHYGCKDCPELWSDESPSTMNWGDCMRWCGNNIQEGFDDWRVPTLMEAIELTELSQSTWNTIWTTTPITHNGMFSLLVEMNSPQNFITGFYSMSFTTVGGGYWYDNNGNASLYCRCIR